VHKKKQVILKKAAELFGGREKLAAHLGVSVSLLDGWLRGDVTMPDGMLFALAKKLDALATTKSGTEP
jgi:DNA-binding transcriptional regulator YdaS (Cro superfamily)